MTDREKVARAMANVHGLDWDGKAKGTEYANHGYWLPLADAALSAMQGDGWRGIEIASPAEDAYLIERAKRYSRDNFGMGSIVGRELVDDLCARIEALSRPAEVSEAMVEAGASLLIDDFTMADPDMGSVRKLVVEIFQAMLAAKESG